MPAGKIHIGTSGWSYKHWKNSFYPEGLKTTEWLAYYAKSFSITEINTSFYHLPKDTTVIGWSEKVPKRFRFCPKISRYITHIKRLKDPEQTLEKFFNVFDLMKERLGPVLIQLPPTLQFNYDVAEHFYTELQRYKGYSYVMEVRHDTWLSEDSLTLMSKFKIGLVISQSGDKFPYSEMVTAKNIYVRFHGPKELYASSYTDEQLMSFAEKFKAWIGKGHVIWAFFNNDVHGYAYVNAKRLEEMMQA